MDIVHTSWKGSDEIIGEVPEHALKGSQEEHLHSEGFTKHASFLKTFNFGRDETAVKAGYILHCNHDLMFQHG